MQDALFSLAFLFSSLDDYTYFSLFFISTLSLFPFSLLSLTVYASPYFFLQISLTPTFLLSFSLSTWLKVSFYLYVSYHLCLSLVLYSFFPLSCSSSSYPCGTITLLFGLVLLVASLSFSIHSNQR